MTLNPAIFPDADEERDFQKASEEAERELFPPVLRLYRVPESQQFDISDMIEFLVTNPDLTEILTAAIPHLESVFGKAYRYLELERDPDGGEEEIFAVILFRGIPERALELLRQFDELWFSEVAKNIDNRLNFTVEIEDDDPV